jgi:hypothetical protein
MPSVLLTFVLLVVEIATCETSKRTWSKVSDQGLEICDATSIIKAGNFLYINSFSSTS